MSINIKKLFTVVAVTATTVVIGFGAWAFSHTYRSDATIVAVSEYNLFYEIVTVRLDGEPFDGHLFAFDVIDVDNVHNVGDTPNFRMWDGLTPDDPTDDRIFNPIEMVIDEVKEVLF